MFRLLLLPGLLALIGCATSNAMVNHRHEGNAHRSPHEARGRRIPAPEQFDRIPPSDARRRYIELFNSDRPRAGSFAEAIGQWLQERTSNGSDAAPREIEELAVWFKGRKEIARLFQHDGADLANCAKECYATGRHLPYSRRPGRNSRPGEKPGFTWLLPPGFPLPRDPDKNRMTQQKVDLGRHLFYDARLSGNGRQACASCHRPELAFTDGRPRAVGSTGQMHRRNTMTLANVVYAEVLTWADPALTSLERQALIPMFGEHPVELGLAGGGEELLARLTADDRYGEMFLAAFPDEGDAITVDKITRALAAFERTIISGDSRYDRLVYGGRSDALSESAWRGMRLFFSERTGCARCHGGFNLSGAVVTRGIDVPMASFHNTGLYNTDGKGAYPAEDQGLVERLGRTSDMGRFRAPTLRNIAVTAPYMHDGGIATLAEVVDHYARGGRAGASNPYTSHLVMGFDISAIEKADLVEFLESLTDESFLVDSRFSNPWGHDDSSSVSSSSTSPHRRSRPIS